MTRDQKQLWLGVATALTLGLLLRVWFITHAARIAGDTLLYGDIARNWMERGVYGFSVTAAKPQPTLIRLPGYPLFLAFCFALFGMEHYTAVMYVQVVFDLLTCLILAALARNLFGNRAGIGVLWLSALCPFTASYVSAPLTEILTIFCIALAFLSLERWQALECGLNRWLWLIGAAAGYAILLRPEQGLLVVAILPAMVWMERIHDQGSRKWRLARYLAPAFTVALCALLPLVPWTIRNWRTFHVLQPLAPRYATDPGEEIPLGFQRWYRTWAIDFASTEEVYWNYDGAPIEISDLPTRAFDSTSQYIRTEELLREYDQNYSPTPALDDRFNELASERIHADSLRYYIALPVARLLNMCFRPRTEMLPIALEWWHLREHPTQTVVALLLGAINFAYFAAGAWGLWVWRRAGWGGKEPLALALIATILLRSALLLTLDNSEPRYTLEFFPVLILLAGALFAGTKLVGAVSR